MCICETFLLEGQEINVPGYKWFGNNRKQVSKRACRGSGGVGILIGLNVLEIFDVAVISEKFEGILWVQLIHKLNKTSIGICACYLPPIGSSRGDQSIEFFDTIKALIIDNYHMEDFVICGDFNARCGNMDETSGLEGGPVPARVAVDMTSNQLGKELIATLKALDLCILNGRFAPNEDGHTSISNLGMSVVDYIITPVKSFSSLHNFKVLDPFQVATESNIVIDSSMPDHRILAVHLALNKARPYRYSPSNGMPAKKSIKRMPENFMLDPGTVDRLESLADMLDSNDPLLAGNCEIDDVYNEFCAIVDSQLVTKHVTCNRKHRSLNKAWWNDSLKALAKEVRRTLKAWEANKRDTQLRLDYLSKQKEFSKTVRRCKRRYRRDRNNRLLQEQKTNPNVFWNFIKKLGGEDKGNLPDTVTDAKGRYVSEPAAVKEEWRGYFQNLLNPRLVAPKVDSEYQGGCGHSHVRDIGPEHTRDIDSEELNEDISIEEVRAAIFANSDNKSPGIDGIKPAFIKNETCVRFIHSLCNHCFKTGTVPKAWLKAVIKPIPKQNKGSTLPSEYRGISLQSFVAKTYCRILNTRLRECLELNDALSDEQNGFRPNRCCQDHILTLTSIIENRMLEKQDTFACFIDFKKAFDCVDRDLLWGKLETRYNLNGNFLVALKALYKEVRCAVDINHDLTDWFDVNSGVKQGCILSPTLFAMYIDDLVDQLKGVSAGVVCGENIVSSLLYADDIVLLAPNEESLQEQIMEVEKWCRRWHMSLNIEKTKIVHFRKKLRSKQRSEYNFLFNSEKIEYASEYKYLGLTLTEHLDWSNAIEEIHKKANRALALLNHRARMCGGFHFDTYSMLFKQLVQPIIMCNASIWGHTESRMIAGIQHNALRFVLGVGKACPLAGLFGETGWVPLSMMLKFSIVSFRRRIMKMDCTRLTRKICMWSQSLAGDRFKNWAWKTKKLLEDINDFGELLSADELWSALAQQELKLWKDNVATIPQDSESGGRFNFYRNIKSSPATEQYVLNSVNLNKRRVITQLRCGCLPLEIELGRYRSPKQPLSQRTCLLCHLEVGDEPHFLLVCPGLSVQREAMIEAMENSAENYSLLSVKGKVEAILKLCASSPAVSNSIYRMYRQRCNMLR